VGGTPNLAHASEPAGPQTWCTVCSQLHAVYEVSAGPVIRSGPEIALIDSGRAWRELDWEPRRKFRVGREGIARRRGGPRERHEPELHTNGPTRDERTTCKVLNGHDA